MGPATGLLTSERQLLLLDEVGDVEHRQVQADQDAADGNAHDDDEDRLDETGESVDRVVDLAVVEVGGWATTDVKALVLDLPNQPDVGLLGLNYLSRFRMDLNTEKGILILEPR